MTAASMTRYVPARHYLWFGIAAAALAGVIGWLGWDWMPIALGGQRHSRLNGWFAVGDGVPSGRGGP